jgi:5-formyltetrahydrofolate cyclo-ligase
MQTKKELRPKLREMRYALPKQERARLSALICQRVMGHAAFAKANTIHCFVPMIDEVDVREVMAGALAAGKNVVSPLFVKGSRETQAYRVRSLDPAEFKRGDWGLAVPRHLELAALDEIDLVVVPLLGFAPRADGKFDRLGNGIAYYDTLLTHLRPDVYKLGVAFAFQRCQPWPVDPHDVALDEVITDDGQ